MQIDLFIHSAAQLLTILGGPQRGSALGNLDIIEDGAVAVHNGTIVATGTTVNAAAAIGMADRVGSLDVGKQAQVLILDVPDY